MLYFFLSGFIPISVYRNWVVALPHYAVSNSIVARCPAWRLLAVNAGQDKVDAAQNGEQVRDCVPPADSWNHLDVRE